MAVWRLCLLYMLVHLDGPGRSSEATLSATTATLNANSTALASSSSPATTPGPSTATTKFDLDPKSFKDNNLEFSVRYPDETYVVELSNKTSPQYALKYADYYNKTKCYFAGIKEFQNITSITFRNGSLMVDFTANFKHDESVKDKNYVYRELVEKATRKLAQDPNVDMTYSLPLFVRSIQGADACHFHKCDRGYSCSYDKGDPACKMAICGLNCGNGECKFNALNAPFCSCRETSSHVYYGDTCEKSVEKFELKKDYIIAIAAGVGGAVVLTLSIVILVTCLMRQTKKEMLVKEPIDEKDNRSEQSFQSIKDLENHLREPYKVNTVMTDPTFRRNDRNMTGNHSTPYPVPASPGLRGAAPYDMAANTISEYQYTGVRSPVENVEMRRPSRVRVVDDIEDHPDYNRRESQARDYVDGANFRKNSNFNVLPQKRRSSALDMRTNNMTRNPMFGLQQSRRKSSVFSEIEDNYSKSTMYQPGNNTEFPKRPATSQKVYDYYSRKDSAVIPGRPSVPDIYDYEEDSNRMYAYKKPPQVPMARRY